MQYEKTAILVVTGQSTIDPVRSMLTELLCRLHANYAVLRSAHWQVFSTAQYGDHLLFQRLYDPLDGEIDKIAERMVYVVGSESVNADGISSGTNDLILDYMGVETDPYVRALCMEQDLIDCLERTIDVIEESGSYSLGWDDVLGAIASQHEDHLYLLNQRIRSI